MLLGLEAKRAEVIARVMGLLSDPTRLRLLASVAEQELTVGELGRRLRCVQPTVSHHLAAMRQAGLVVARRDGKHVHYGLGEMARYAGAGVLEIAGDAASVRLTLPTTRRRVPK